MRRVAGGGESPWPGLLVSTPEGTTGVLVDAALLPVDWRGWDAAATGHLLAPLDVLRRPDGHDVLLPVCSERVTAFVERRAAARTDLTAGEAVNLAVSLLRGLAEAGGQGSGTWWLTDSGRPVLASDLGEDIVAGTVDLGERLAGAAPGLAGALAATIEALQRGSLVREIDRLEAMMFAIEAPLPLATTVFGPRYARSVSVADDESPAEADDPPRAHWSTGLARHLDADWADVVSRTTTGVWRALRTRRTTGRARPLIAGGAIAAAVLALGLLWPTGPDAPATADGPPTGSAPTVSASPPAASAPDDTTSTGTTPGAGAPSAPSADVESDAGRSHETAAPPAPDGDLAAVTAQLLDARLDCAGDAECLRAVQESPGATYPAGAVDLPGEERTVTLLDEFGGVAVLRIDPSTPATPAQLTVIVRLDERWLLRDVHDVAAQ